MKHILIIYDDIHINDMLEKVLTQAEYKVSHAYSGTEALLFLKSKTPDLVLLDLMLPGLNGEEVLPHIKGIPVIVMSAKVDVENKVNLLLGGAVDYITKPFYTKELLARIAVHLRTFDTLAKSELLTFGEIVLNMDTRIVKIKDTEMKLTRTEYAILKILMQNPTQVVSKSQLLDRISEDTPDCTESSLKTHISNLRKKLREASGKEIAFVAIYTLIAMSCPNKAVTAVICILLAFLFLFFGMQLNKMLSQPEAVLGMTIEDGVQVSKEFPNPNYLNAEERKVVQFAYDFTPGGQVAQCVSMDAVNLPLLPLYSSVIALSTTGIGLFYFKKKDLK